MLKIQNQLLRQYDEYAVKAVGHNLCSDAHYGELVSSSYEEYGSFSTAETDQDYLSEIGWVWEEYGRSIVSVQDEYGCGMGLLWDEYGRGAGYGTSMEKWGTRGYHQRKVFNGFSRRLYV